MMMTRTNCGQRSRRGPRTPGERQGNARGTPGEAVSRVKYPVRHHYRYVYTSPIFDVRQRLIMIPPDRHADQMLVSFDLDVWGSEGHLAIDWQTDAFGNRVYRVEAERVN